MLAAASTPQDAVPKHFDGRRFFNPDGQRPAGWLDFFRWKLTSRPQVSPRFNSDVEQSVPPKRVEGGALKITMVNHATVLLQQWGVNILTDPIWSERASPISWVGPQRRRAPGIAFENLPPIDLVLISHDHYDHLDLPALRRLGALHSSPFVAPVGTASLLSSRGIGPLHVLDWGESFRALDCAIHSVPAVHFSGRGLFGRNRSLWCGYVIESHGRLIYFAGDTAYGNHFAQIRKRFDAPQVALLPIGAYEPRWFMSAVHMAPDEAVKAHEILGPKTSIAIHHGTFQLADDAIETPKRAPCHCSVFVYRAEERRIHQHRMTIARHTLALFSIVGCALDVLGSLYLAYDLLGGEHGPLRTLTRAVTYGALFGIGFGSFLGPVFAVVTGITQGITLGWEFSRASRGKLESGFWFDAATSVIRGIGFGLGAAYLYGAKFGLTFGTLTAVGQTIAYQFGMRPTMEYGPSLRLLVTKFQLLGVLNRTVGYAVSGYLSAVIAGEREIAIGAGVKLGVAIGLLTLIVGACIPVIEWFADHAPERRMGVFGVVLLLIGFGLQSLQYWAALLEVGVR